MNHAELPETTQIAGVETVVPRRVGPRDIVGYYASIPKYAYPFPELVHKHPIGPQDASDTGRPYLEMRAHGVAVVAVHNVIHFADERDRLIEDTHQSFLDGSLRLSHDEGAPIAETQAKQIVDEALARYIPQVQSEDIGQDLFLESLKAREDLGQALQESETRAEAAIAEMRREHIEKILALRQLFINGRSPSKRALREFDKAAGVATAFEEEILGFRDIVGHLIGERAAAVLLRSPAPLSAEVEIISPTTTHSLKKTP
jgi:hypothetical protein